MEPGWKAWASLCRCGGFQQGSCLQNCRAPCIPHSSREPRALSRNQALVDILFATGREPGPPCRSGPFSTNNIFSGGGLLTCSARGFHR